MPKLPAGLVSMFWRAAAASMASGSSGWIRSISVSIWFMVSCFLMVFFATDERR